MAGIYMQSLGDKGIFLTVCQEPPCFYHIINEQTCHRAERNCLMFLGTYYWQLLLHQSDPPLLEISCISAACRAERLP